MMAFCLCSESARDGIATLAKEAELPHHPLESTMIPTQLTVEMGKEQVRNTEGKHLPLKISQINKYQHGTNPSIVIPQSPSWLPYLSKPVNTKRLLNVIEFYACNFIGITQKDFLEKMQHFSRVILHGINSVFPDRISKIKLAQEGMWKTKKETLGWIIDGMKKMMELPPKKINVIMQENTQSLRKGYISHKDL